MPHATEPRPALVVAHGQPSAPAGPEADLALFAAAVAAAAGGRRVLSATLAAPGALEAALAETGPAPVVWPLFMADGWFTGTLLPRRLAEAGAAQPLICAPFGLDPALPGLIAGRACEAAARAGHAPGETGVLLAAHGSPSNPRPRAVAEAVARAVAAEGGFRAVRTGFVDEAPGIAETAADLAPPALCLPFFAMRAGHVLADVPEALGEAGFRGPLLPPIGTDPAVPALAAAAIAARAAEPGAAVAAP